MRVLRMQIGRASLLTSPHSVRLAATPSSAAAAASTELKVAGDVWALAVALYYMLFCRFPFSRGEVRAWAGQAAPQWDGDAGVTYTSAPPF